MFYEKTSNGYEITDPPPGVMVTSLPKGAANVTVKQTYALVLFRSNETGAALRRSRYPDDADQRDKYPDRGPGDVVCGQDIGLSLDSVSQTLVCLAGRKPERFQVMQPLMRRGIIQGHLSI